MIKDKNFDNAGKKPTSDNFFYKQFPTKRCQLIALEKLGLIDTEI